MSLHHFEVSGHLLKYLKQRKAGSRKIDIKGGSSIDNDNGQDNNWFNVQTNTHASRASCMLAHFSIPQNEQRAIHLPVVQEGFYQSSYITICQHYAT